MTAPTETSIYSPGIVGTLATGARKLPPTDMPWPVVAGSTVRRDIKLVRDTGSTLNLTGVLEAAKVVLTVRNATTGALVVKRSCSPVLRSAGWWAVQLVATDTALLKQEETYRYDLWLVYPDGSEVPLFTGPQPFVIIGAMYLTADALSLAEALIPTGVSSGKPTRVISPGDSISAGGVTATRILGSWQWWYQHFCNLFNKDIIWVGPGAISGAPTTVDGLPWIPNTAGFSGALINTIGGSLGIQPSWPGYATTYLPQVCLQMIGTNNLQATSQHQAGDVAFAALTGLYNIQLPAFAGLAQPCVMIASTVIPQGRTFSITPAYPGYTNEAGTDLFNSLLGADVASRAASGTAIRLSDPAARFKRYLGPLLEDWSGSADGDAHAVSVAGTGYDAVGSGGANTPGLLADGLHNNWLGCRLMAEEFFLNSYDLLADKV